MSEKHEEAFTLKDAIAFVSKIQDKYSTGKYIFRGTNRVYSDSSYGDGINSSLYRSIVYPDPKDVSKREGAFDGSYFIVKAEKEVVKKVKYLFPPPTDTLTMLTDIQHFKGKTNLIDFSKDMYIALFFACNGELDKDGELLLLEVEEKGVKSISQLEYNNADNLPELALIEPPATSSSEVRVKVQRSVFVYSKKGYIPVEKLKKKIISIPSKNKGILLRYLDNYLNITARTIYNDLIGFVENEESYEVAGLWFDRGNVILVQGDFFKAIEYYNKALELNSKYAKAYANRGKAKQELKEYDEAIKDYDKALGLNPKLVEAYINRGGAKMELKEYDKAIKDYDKALELNPNLAKTYEGLILAYLQSNDFTTAEEYYKELLRLDEVLAGEMKEVIDEARGTT